jgi:hypothetical protein
MHQGSILSPRDNRETYNNNCGNTYKDLCISTIYILFSCYLSLGSQDSTVGIARAIGWTAGV